MSTNSAHLCLKHNIFMAGVKKITGNAAPQASSSNRRKAGDEDSDVAVIIDGPKSPPLSRSRQKRKKKF